MLFNGERCWCINPLVWYKRLYTSISKNIIDANTHQKTAKIYRPLSLQKQFRKIRLCVWRSPWIYSMFSHIKYFKSSSVNNHSPKIGLYILTIDPYNYRCNWKSSFGLKTSKPVVNLWKMYANALKQNGHSWTKKVLKKNSQVLMKRRLNEEITIPNQHFSHEK